jgi:hypothetical protein
MRTKPLGVPWTPNAKVTELARNRRPPSERAPQRPPACVVTIMSILLLTVLQSKRFASRTSRFRRCVSRTRSSSSFVGRWLLYVSHSTLSLACPERSRRLPQRMRLPSLRSNMSPPTVSASPRSRQSRTSCKTGMRVVICCFLSACFAPKVATFRLLTLTFCTSLQQAG